VKIAETQLEGVFLVELVPVSDARGHFMRTFCSTTFTQHGLTTFWPQSNLSFTASKGTLRGLHFQKEPSPEIKLIQCVTGTICDVIVDIRKDSPSFGHWESFELSEENHRGLYVPAGYAHGFQCLEDKCRVSYQMSQLYDPSLSGGVRWNDPDLKIDWPLNCPLVSERDAALPFLADLE
jgi:dTDP-4-dehydrorhamnose 3,5-epimerase